MNDLQPKLPLWRTVWRVIIGIIGTLVLLVGIALIVLPGPAFILIPLGLAILALEFPWAKRVLDRVKEWLTRRKNRN